MSSTTNRGQCVSKLNATSYSLPEDVEIQDLFRLFVDSLVQLLGSVVPDGRSDSA